MVGKLRLCPFLLVFSVFAFVLTAALPAEEGVDSSELQTVKNDIDSIIFISNTATPSRIDTRDEIFNLGASLGAAVARGAETAGQRGRYFVIHKLYPPELDKLDADILGLGVNAGVDTIGNLRLIIQGYLQFAYKYKAADAALLAEYITIYNAVHRTDRAYFTKRYKTPLLGDLTPGIEGIALRYDEWPGKTLLVIPLLTAESGSISAIDTSSITEKPVIDKMREAEDHGIEQRQGMVDLKEREAEAAQEKSDKLKEQNQAEEKRIETEKDRIAQEEDRQQKEEARQQNEEARQQNEEVRQQKEEEAISAAKAEAETPEEKAAVEEREAQLNKDKEQLNQDKEQLNQDKEQLNEDKEGLAGSKEAVQADEAALEKNKKAEEDSAALAERKSQEAESEREAISSEQTAMINEDKAKEQASTPAEPSGIPAVRFSGKSALGRLVKVNPKSAEILKTSALGDIFARTLTQAGDKFIAVIKSGSDYKLVEIDPISLSSVAQSEDKLNENTLLWIQGKNIYAIITEGGKNYLAAFDFSLKRSAKSVVAVHPWASPIFQSGLIIIQNESGNLVSLKAEDLSAQE